MAVTPAGQGNDQEVERLHDRGHWTNRLSVILPNNNIIRLVRIFAPYAIRQHKSVVNPKPGQLTLSSTAGERIAAGSPSFRWQLNYEFETHRLTCEPFRH